MRPVHPLPGPLPALLFQAMQRMPRTVASSWIDHRIQDGEDLPFAGLRAIHAPGHCAGQIVLLWPERRLLFAADAAMHLVGLRMPLVNEDAPLARRSLQRIGELDFEIACFGHGRPIMSAAAALFRRKFGTPAA